MIELVLGALVLLALVIFIFLWMTYNKLVTLKERMNNAWAQIDVQLKRRFDLIPNLIETVKGYAKHEKQIFTDVAKLRSGLMKGNPEQKAAADGLLTSALGKLFAISERYPKLRANENFLKLQEELSGTEDKISFVRTAYNDYVYSYNRDIKLFPTNLIAGMMGFSEAKYFKPPEQHRKNISVKFD